MHHYSTPTVRHTGQVKFFDQNRGYGFILPKDSQGEDVFVHYTAIQDQYGYRYLVKDQEVEFDLIHGPKGMQAEKVTGVGGRSIRTDSSQSHTYRTPPQYYPHGKN